MADLKENVDNLLNSGLRFDEAPHIYTYEGEEIPSVTTIMAPLSQAEYSGISEKVIGKAADRGTVVHNSIENHIKFDFDDIEPEFEGYLDAYKKWEDEKKPEYVASEMRLFHPLRRYAGTLDLLVKLNGKLTLIDLKTTSKLNEMSVPIQLEAYANALMFYQIKVDDKMILLLKKDGSYKEYHYKAQDAEALTVFNSLKVTYDWMKKFQKSKKPSELKTSDAELE